MQAGDLDLSTPTGRALARTITAWALAEVEVKAVRQVRARRQAAEAGMTNTGVLDPSVTSTTAPPLTRSRVRLWLRLFVLSLRV